MSDSDRSTIRTDHTVLSSERQWLRTGFDLHLIGPDGERRVPLCYSHMTIGCEGEKNNDIVVSAPGVANRQGLLKLIQGQVYFNNIHPAFPIEINGEVATFRQLKPNDELTIASMKVRLVRLREDVAFLEGYTDPHRRQHWTLTESATIGREGRRQNTVTLDDRTVSRVHATIESKDGVFALRPESDNPTWINAEPVEGMRILKDEDLIQIGQQLLRFRTYKATTRPRALLPKEATILFSDIWDYTRLAESRPLEETISQLNEVYKSLGAVIVAHQGILMTYLGDAMMAVFGAQAEDPDEDHAQHAVEAGLKMLVALEELNQNWSTRNTPALRIGIGIASGEVMVGDVGVTGHREFAAMGDTTNVASRIEKLTRDFNAHVLIAGSTEQQVRECFETRSLGTSEIRGRRSTVEVFEVLGPRQ
ncbi:MAG: adenylate/guanylate cyclase domain-containing protein [Candidatus Eremiobacteraeota bacterium]|nr:adenylate/guanylate cyclase domain-containing protein [Candidatus Eremiobacteraeota bacterium]